MHHSTRFFLAPFHCLINTTGYCVKNNRPVFVTIAWFVMLPVFIHAETPTDEELNALEKQILQQEAEQVESKKRAEAEAKRKAEKEARKVELEKQRIAEDELRKVAEKEEEARKQAEEQKRRAYDRFMAEAEKSIKSNDFERAENYYRDALVIFQDDKPALNGLDHIRVLKNRCQSIIGEWGWDGTTQTMIFEPGGIVVHRAALNTVVRQNWECADPENYRFIMKGGGGEIDYYLSEDGNQLKGYDPWGNISFANRITKH